MYFSKTGNWNLTEIANRPPVQGHLEDDDPTNFATGNFSSSSSSRNSSSPTEASIDLNQSSALTIGAFNVFQAVKKTSKANESVFKSHEPVKESAWFDDKEKKATNKLLEQISNLYLNQEMSDVVFVVEGQRFPAHKLILAARCKYFKAMFTIGLSESTQKEISFADISAQAFALLLAYFYTSTMDLKANGCDLNIELLGLAHKYELLELQDLVAHHLEGCLSVDNIFSVLPAAMLYSLKQLVDQCINFCQKNMLHVLESKLLPVCTFEVLQEVMNRINWKSSESQIALSIISWIRANRQEAEPIRELMRQKADLELLEINGAVHIFKRLHIVGGTLCSEEPSFGQASDNKILPNEQNKEVNALVPANTNFFGIKQF